MTAPGGHLVRALVAVGTLSCFLAAFDGGSAALGDSSASPAPTTTLPVAIDIPGSAAGGAFAALGPVRRVDVLPVVPGRVAPKLLADGTMPARSLRVAYRQFGSGPDLLLITGEHGSLTSWDPQVLVALGTYYRVTVFDLPGVGYSEPSRGAETVPRLADLTAGLIWSLGLSQPTVVGWGLGG
ncbi:MAG: alpha/beta fold hydrolase, partial [Acidimicrobiales bacterium]